MERDLQEVVDLLDDGEGWKVTDKECLLVLEAVYGIPLELLEAKLAQFRGEELLNSEGV